MKKKEKVKILNTDTNEVKEVDDIWESIWGKDLSDWMKYSYKHEWEKSVSELWDDYRNFKN